MSVHLWDSDVLSLTYLVPWIAEKNDGLDLVEYGWVEFWAGFLPWVRNEICAESCVDYTGALAVAYERECLVWAVLVLLIESVDDIVRTNVRGGRQVKARRVSTNQTLVFLDNE